MCRSVMKLLPPNAHVKSGEISLCGENITAYKRKKMRLQAIALFCIRNPYQLQHFHSSFFRLIPGYFLVAYLQGDYVGVSGLDGLDTTRVLGHHSVGVMWNIEDWTITK